MSIYTLTITVARIDKLNALHEVERGAPCRRFEHRSLVACKAMRNAALFVSGGAMSEHPRHLSPGQSCVLVAGGVEYCIARATSPRK